MPTTDNDPVLPSVSFTMTGNGPYWIHCKQPNPKPHCAQGMVFAINPGPEGTDLTFELFQARANATLNAPTTAADVFATPTSPVWPIQTVTVTAPGGSPTTVTYASYPAAPSPTFAPEPVVHNVTVGLNGAFAFSPNNITAALNDIVEFEFHQKNHTFTRSSFSTPCLALKDAQGNNVLDSGFMPVAAGVTSDFPKFRITINDTAPLWASCQQPGHCGAGMVFAINAPPSGNYSFENFVQMAERTSSTFSLASTGGNGSTTSPSPAPKSAGVMNQAALGPVVAFFAFVAMLW